MYKKRRGFFEDEELLQEEELEDEGFCIEDLEAMDEDDRYDALEDAGLSGDDYDF